MPQATQSSGRNKHEVGTIGDREWIGEMPSLRCVPVEDLSGEPNRHESEQWVRNAANTVLPAR